MIEKVIAVVLPVLLLAAGVAGMLKMKSMRQPPRKQEKSVSGVLVEAMQVSRSDRQVTVRAFGTVQPSREIALTPQIQGYAIWISDTLVQGGFCSNGETLVKIDPADFEIRVQQANASVAKAEYELSVIEAQAKVARMEWQSLQQSKATLPDEYQLADTKPDPLAFYEPQLKNAKAALTAAKATWQQANLDLSRTILKAPFACRVRNEHVDVGQFLRAGESLALLFATDTVEVLVQLPAADLDWIDVPGRSRRERSGSEASVMLRMGDRHYSWEAVAVRSLGEVETAGRMVGVVFQVQRPFDDKAEAGTPQLRVNDYVEVRIQGHSANHVVAIPRAALRRNNTVWVAVDDVLQIRQAVVVRVEEKDVLLRSGLEAGDDLILTSISGAINGMPIRLQTSTASEASPEDSHRKEDGDQR